jgi:acyl carrier protein
MMEMNEILEGVRAILVEEGVLAAGSVTEDDVPLLDTARLRSVTVVGVVTKIEARFGLRLAPDDITPDNLQSVRSMAALVGRIRGLS